MNGSLGTNEQKWFFHVLPIRTLLLQSSTCITLTSPEAIHLFEKFEIKRCDLVFDIDKLFPIFYVNIIWANICVNIWGKIKKNILLFSRTHSWINQSWILILALLSRSWLFVWNMLYLSLLYFHWKKNCTSNIDSIWAKYI